MMTVKPGIGIDDLKFGMTEGQIVELIGKPTEIVFDEEDDDENPVYQYNELKLRLTFYSEYDKKFGYARVANPSVSVNGKPVIGIETDAVFEVFGLKEDKWIKEAYFTFNAYFNESIWTTLNEEYGVVNHIEFGYLFDESGEKPVWPK
jgi:hypothetical protein